MWQVYVKLENGGRIVRVVPSHEWQGSERDGWIALTFTRADSSAGSLAKYDASKASR